ncbi:MAG: HD-GYP domain-containing protein [Actinomycetota bacterium]|nr:HD-GYP domain-containing protein [Actinomycetota bacterium]
MRASSVWVIVAAVVLAIALIVAATTLQHHASASRDAQVELGQVQREFDALQSVPYDVIGSAGPAADARVLKRLEAGESRIDTQLAGLRAGALTSHLDKSVAPYKANLRVLEHIRRLLVGGRQARADTLGPAAGRLQGIVNRELDLAAADYRARATSSQSLATEGSAAMIILLVGLFCVLYLRERKSHATAERLTREHAQLSLQDSQLLVVQRLAVAAEYRDDDTGQHTRRVGRLSELIGAALDVPEEQLLLLRQAAPLHDVGKIGIPDSILLKRGRLTRNEFERMKAHTSVGAAMLAGRNFPLLAMAEEIALGHHERWDGTGYPRGIAGEAIPLVARIVAVADVFDALTHARPYKEAWTVTDAITEIARQRGKQFDGAVVDAFLRVLPQVLAGFDGEPNEGVTIPQLGTLRAA